MVLEQVLKLKSDLLCRFMCSPLFLYKCVWVLFVQMCLDGNDPRPLDHTVGAYTHVELVMIRLYLMSSIILLLRREKKKKAFSYASSSTPHPSQ